MDAVKFVRLATRLALAITLMIAATIGYIVVRRLTQQPYSPPRSSAQVVQQPAGSPPPANPGPQIHEQEPVRSGSQPQQSAPVTPPPISPQTPNPAQITQTPTVPAAVKPSITQPPTVSKPLPARSGAAPRPRTLRVASGTPVNVKLEEPLSTEQAKTGKLFRASLASAIVTDGFVVAQAGSYVTGKVLESRRAGVFGRRPELQLVLLDIQATDKQVVRVQTGTWDDTGRAHNPLAGTMRSAMGAVSGAVTGAARGSGMMPENCDQCALNSRVIMLPANTTLQFRLVAPVLVTERKR